jgi:hypothetical protein
MWIERLARFGYTTKGIVYVIIGILAVMAAFGTGGKTTGSKGAIRTIAAQPFGQFLLILAALGLLGYVIWRFVEAIKDPDNKGTDAKGIVTRIGYAISGSIYATLAFYAANMALGSGGASGGNSKQDWTARLLAQPFGRWLVGIIGIVIIGVGFYRLYKAYKTKFRRKLNLRELSLSQERAVVNTCRFGIAARGVVFVLIGIFLTRAARQYDASEVKGLDGILLTVAQQPFGKFLLTLVALGLVAYGIYMLVQARYRQIQTT